MQSRVEIVHTRDTIRAAAERMRDHDIGFLPVLDDKDLCVGVVTDRDITVRATAEGQAPDSPVAGCMTREVTSCQASDGVDRAEELMALYQRSRIIVLDEEGHLGGVISLSDLARNVDRRETGETIHEVKADSPER